jgi:U3 small nucleolar RNA-associated protein 5
MVASIPLDSDSKTISLYIPSAVTSTSKAKKQILATLSATGMVSIFPVPDELSTPASSKGTAHKVPTLLPRSIVSPPPRKSSPTVKVIDASFIADKDGQIQIARLVAGVRPVFDLVVGHNFLYLASC